MCGLGEAREASKLHLDTLTVHEAQHPQRHHDLWGLANLAQADDDHAAGRW